MKKNLQRLHSPVSWPNKLKYVIISNPFSIRVQKSNRCQSGEREEGESHARIAPSPTSVHAACDQNVNY